MRREVADQAGMKNRTSEDPQAPSNPGRKDAPSNPDRKDAPSNPDRKDAPSNPDRKAARKLPSGPDYNQACSEADDDAHRLRKGLIWTAGLAVLLLGIGFAIPNARSVLERISDAGPGWVVLAIGLEIASCLGYVMTVRLVLRRAPAREARWLSWAELAFGAVLPVGGAGGLAVGAWAMREWGAGWSRILSRSAVIFLLTSAVNGAVLVLAGLGVWLGIGSDKTGILYGGVPATATALGLTFFIVMPVVNRRIGAKRLGRLGPFVERMASWVSDTEEVALRPDPRLLGAVGYLLFDIAVLWVCLRAVGVSAPLLALVVGYQVGYLSNLIPVPGGLGVLDGGLLGALVLYGLPAAPTAAAVVLYHAIALWVPTLGGTYGFFRLRRSLADGPPLLAPRQTAAVGEANPA